jgi:hypothetical protein
MQHYCAYSLLCFLTLYVAMRSERREWEAQQLARDGRGPRPRDDHVASRCAREPGEERCEALFVEPGIDLP